MGSEAAQLLPGSYMMIASMKVRSNFNVPPRHRKADTYCEVEFQVLKDGTIAEIRVSKTSGDPVLDQYAVQALKDTRTLQALPDSLRKSSVTFNVTFNFSSTSK